MSIIVSSALCLLNILSWSIIFIYVKDIRLNWNITLFAIKYNNDITLRSYLDWREFIKHKSKKN